MASSETAEQASAEADDDGWDDSSDAGMDRVNAENLLSMQRELELLREQGDIAGMGSLQAAMDRVPVKQDIRDDPNGFSIDSAHLAGPALVIPPSHPGGWMTLPPHHPSASRLPPYYPRGRSGRRAYLLCQERGGESR